MCRFTPFPVAGLILAGLILGASGSVVSGSHAESGASPRTYADSIRAWQDNRRTRLTSDTGWLTVAGLFWLEPGENRVGSGADNRVVLPAGAAPEHVGSFVLTADSTGNRVTLRADPASGVKIDEATVTERVLATDASEHPDIVKVGRLSLFVIDRGGRLAIRMRDPESAMRKSFQGLDMYPIDEGARVVATYAPFATPRKIPVPNIMGYTDSMAAPGQLSFRLRGVACTLTPLLESPTDSSFFIIFSDSTTGSETYGGGRFLYADPPRAGEVVLDFNRAYNPPCAFTPFTTCPMPPEGNDLPLAVRAGEKKYRAHD